ncbi:hypothetical protein HDZ31DRAFT_70286 [Schizophyllum fasciatum]
MSKEQDRALLNMGKNTSAAREATDAARQVDNGGDEVATSQDAELMHTQVLVPSTQMSDDVSLSQQYLAYAVAWPPTQPRDVGDKHDEEKAGDGGDCAVDRATGEQQAAKDAQTKASDAHKNPVDPELRIHHLLCPQMRTHKPAQVSDQEVQPKPAVRQSKDQVVLEMEGADEDATGETEDSGDEAQTGGSAVQVPGEKKKVESGSEKTGEMSMVLGLHDLLEQH